MKNQAQVFSQNEAQPDRDGKKADPEAACVYVKVRERVGM